MNFTTMFKKKNREHPKFTEGKSAFYNGLELSDNPYSMDTDFSPNGNLAGKSHLKHGGLLKRRAKRFPSAPIPVPGKNKHEELLKRKAKQLKRRAKQQGSSKWFL